MTAREESPLPTSLPTDNETGDSAGERPVVEAENDEPRQTPPEREDDEVGRLPLLLYVFIGVLLMAATVSLVA